MAWVIARRTDRGRRYQANYRDPGGRQRSAGTYGTRREAKVAGLRAEERVRGGCWVDPADGKMPFATFVDRLWLPELTVEVSTAAAYRSYLRAHFLPAFGHLPINRVSGAAVQAWVDGVAGRLSPTSVVKYHAMLSSLFADAQRRGLREDNPCTLTVLPAAPSRIAVARMRRVLTPAQFAAFLAWFQPRHQLLLLTAIETGLRWGELIALRPRHVDLARRVVRVEQVIVEVSKKDSPTGERFVVKDYPKTREPRPVTISAHLCDLLAQHMEHAELDADGLLFTFARSPGRPMSRHTFRKRHWRPAVAAAGLDFDPTVHDLRHAHASWLLAGGLDVESVKERLGHQWLSTTQLYLHTLPDAGQRAVEVFEAFRDSHGATPPARSTEPAAVIRPAGPSGTPRRATAGRRIGGGSPRSGSSGARGPVRIAG